MSAPSPSYPSVNPAAVTGRLAINPPKEPDSRLWFSDREIGARRRSVALAYTADDFRDELRRVERGYYLLSFACVALSVVAVIAIIGMILRIV